MDNKSKEKLKTLLFDAFANPEYCNVQDQSVFWAINEGRNRVPELELFGIPTARKQHNCVRGCQIHVGDVYFVSDQFWSMKMCASCMAMILYYLQVWNLPPYYYDYWDNELQCPHFATNGTMQKRLDEAIMAQKSDGIDL